MAIIKLTRENIDNEHICCAISDKKCKHGVAAKKEMIKSKLDKGYVFCKLDVQGKVFIDYCPVDVSLLPVLAPDYMAINCFWVSGQYAGKGNGKLLMEQCISDCREKNGIVAICGDKKRPFLTDKKFLMKYGFEVCDTAPPYFELLVYKNNSDAPVPQFLPGVKQNSCGQQDGFMVYYSEQCPFTEYYTNTVFKDLARNAGHRFTSKKLETRDDIKDLPSVSNVYSVFFEGKFITHEILSETRIKKLLSGIYIMLP